VSGLLLTTCCNCGKSQTQYAVNTPPLSHLLYHSAANKRHPSPRNTRMI
jgi:hypothetical protein